MREGGWYRQIQWYGGCTCVGIMGWDGVLSRIYIDSVSNHSVPQVGTVPTSVCDRNLKIFWEWGLEIQGWWSLVVIWLLCWIFLLFGHGDGDICLGALFGLGQFR